MIMGRLLLLRWGVSRIIFEKKQELDLRMCCLNAKARFFFVIFAVAGCSITNAVSEDRFKGTARDGYDGLLLIQMNDHLRYKGTAKDGYDRKCFVQTYDRLRFRGAGYDGFDMKRGYNLPVAVFGITFIFY
ncbi:MAG: hypothetical protein A2283_05075 [Lentisphaerae bacterium RIFOXYA12_FULL_48_11]|nr:MAG: hypothetical protein A2283_05075 [Lentisphaerae bacterium RIFOXYA12_FULL_48_11]